MGVITKLTELFAKFPGIGPRQARRFVYYLLRQKKETISELILLLGKLDTDVGICSSCYRYFPRGAQKLCSICADTNRSRHALMVVEKDVDVDNIEKSSAFNGRYFVLGGTILLLDKEPEKKIRIKELLNSLKKKDNVPKEIILALSATPDGEETRDYTAKALGEIAKKHNITLSSLGRGLSTGSELEYSDTETIKNAFSRRT